MAPLRAAVIYFSLDGNTRLLAEEIAAAAKAALLPITVAEEHAPEGGIRHIWGSTQITLPEEPVLMPIEADLDAYDLLFLGTPVWAGGVSPPLRSFLGSREFFRRNFALFASYSGRTGRVFQEFRRLLAGNELLGELGVREPLEQSEEAVRKRTTAWVREIEKELL